MATIQKRGEKYRVMVRRKGHAPVTRTFDAHDTAKRWADELEGRISGETYVDRSEAKALKLRELIERYRDEVTPTKKGAAQEKYRLAQWLREPMADWSIVSVLPKDIAAWRREQEAAGKAPSTINNAVNLLSAIYRTAISEWGLPVTNPCQGVRRVKGRPGREVHLTSEQETILLGECSQPDWLAPLVIVAIETGMRQGELLAMRWTYVHQDHVALPKTKNGDPRRVPLSTRAWKALEDRRVQQTSDAEELSPCPFPISRERVTEVYQAAMKAAGESSVPRLTFHDLRHVAATRLATRLQPLELARVLGHKTLNMVLRYYNPTAGDLAAKIDGRHSGAGVLEEFRAAVEKVLAAGLDPRALLEVLTAEGSPA